MKINYILCASTILIASTEAREHLIQPGAFVIDSADNIPSFSLNPRSMSSRCGGWSKITSMVNHVYEEVTVAWSDSKSFVSSVIYGAGSKSLDDTTTREKTVVPESHDGQIVFQNAANEEYNAGELPQGGPTLLQTGINTVPEISYFAKYLRNSKVFNTRFKHAEQFTTVFAPTNEAMMALEKKPWEFPRLLTSDEHHKKMSEKKMEKIMNCNVKNFLRNHLVTSLDGPYTSASGPVDIRSGSTIIISASDNNNPSDLHVHVVDVRGRTYSAKIVGEKTVQNGRIYLIDGTLSRP